MQFGVWITVMMYRHRVYSGYLPGYIWLLHWNVILNILLVAMISLETSLLIIMFYFLDGSYKTIYSNDPSIEYKIFDSALMAYILISIWVILLIIWGDTWEAMYLSFLSDLF